MKVFQKHPAKLGHAVTILVAQQSYAIRAGEARPRPVLYCLVNPTLDPFCLVRPFGPIAFGDQDVAVGEYEQPSWVIEILGKGIDVQVRKRGWPTIRWPPG